MKSPRRRPIRPPAQTASEHIVDTPESTPADTRGWLEREVEREYSQIRDATLEDANKTFSNAEFEAAIEAMRTFARQRSAFVTSEIAAAGP